jgi:hypothetical protein
MKPNLVAVAAALVVLAGTASCTTVTEEPMASTTAAIDSRFNPNHPPGKQDDDWSCSVFTTSWMLQASGTDESWSSVAAYMKKTGRVTEAQGLSLASGVGLAQTLRDLATGSPDVDSNPDAKFDEVAAKAGHMAVGIGGRAWNHWSGVRGYDAERDVLLLANSAPGWKGTGQELDRGEFSRLGAMSMVWMDYGQGPPPKPFEPAARPGSDPFPALHVKTNIGGDQWITQCSESENPQKQKPDGERVWQTDGSGPEPNTRWAVPKYPQEALNGCGEASPDGVYPLVFRSSNAGDLGAWIVQCSGYGDGMQHVFRIDGDVDGHPAAPFQYNEPNAECD